MQAGDAEHGVVDAVAFQAAVAENPAALQSGEGVLDAGTGLAVGGVVVFLPGGELGPACLAAVRDDKAGTLVAAVRDDRGPADGGPRAGQLPCRECPMDGGSGDRGDA